MIYIDLPDNKQIALKPREIRSLGYQFGMGIVFALLMSAVAALIVFIIVKMLANV